MACWPIGDVLGNLFVQGGKAIHAAMNVTNGINTLARRQYGRSRKKLDHGRSAYAGGAVWPIISWT
jgi:hypothetical protein